MATSNDILGAVYAQAGIKNPPIKRRKNKRLVNKFLDKWYELYPEDYDKAHYRYYGKEVKMIKSFFGRISRTRTKGDGPDIAGFNKKLSHIFQEMGIMPGSSDGTY